MGICWYSQGGVAFRKVASGKFLALAGNKHLVCGLAPTGVEPPIAKGFVTTKGCLCALHTCRLGVQKNTLWVFVGTPKWLALSEASILGWQTPCLTSSRVPSLSIRGSNALALDCFSNLSPWGTKKIPYGYLLVLPRGLEPLILP